MKNNKLTHELLLDIYKKKCQIRVIISHIIIYYTRRYMVKILTKLYTTQVFIFSTF